MNAFFAKIDRRLKRELALQVNRFRLKKLHDAVLSSVDETRDAPVIIFNASTRLSGLSQNAGFSIVTGLALRNAGVPVLHFACDRGLSPCVLGTNREDPSAAPPCRECVRTSKLLFDPSETHWFKGNIASEIAQEIEPLALPALLAFEHNNVPLGEMVLPSLRWILRRHHLQDDADTCLLARSYIQSAWNVYREFTLLLESEQPQAVIVFNGMFYPEAMARLAAQEKGIPVYSHEVGMLPFSAFFTDKEATAYPVKVDNDFLLDEGQNARLESYLSERFKGNFSTAGVAFWPEMKGLDQKISEKIDQFQALVPIFTNVIFDTSQAHANALFETMFSWLDLVVEKIKESSDTLFIIRAHPDEVRSGKESRETVADWFRLNHLHKYPNLIFIPPDEFISSYALIHRAKFVMVYNSTVGLEASILGKPVLCAGKARYTQVPTVFFPKSQRDYKIQLDKFLRADKIDQPKDFIQNARSVLYSQLFRASIPFDDYLQEDGVWKGYVKLKDFKPSLLHKENSEILQVIVDGVLQGKPFIRDL